MVRETICGTVRNSVHEVCPRYSPELSGMFEENSIEICCVTEVALSDRHDITIFGSKIAALPPSGGDGGLRANRTEGGRADGLSVKRLDMTTASWCNTSYDKQYKG